MPADNRRVDFADIRQRVDFRAILAHYGLTPVGKGDQVKILCPFHPDEDPSCSVNLATRVFHCFSCHHAGNVLDFVHRMENRDGEAVSLRQAGILLAEISGIRLPRGNGAQGPKEACTAPRRVGVAPTPPPAPAARPERPQKGNGADRVPDRNKPLGFTLTLNPLHPYLDERGIPHELRERFGLGFCEKGIMAGRVCIPIHNADGQTVAYAGRWVGEPEDLPEGKGKYELPAVALMGTSISVKRLELLAHATARHITVMLDGDEAGRAAAEEVAGATANVAWARIVHLPIGAQPDTIDRAVLGRLHGRGER